MSQTVEEKFSSALAALYNYAPFDASVLQSMLLLEDTTGTIPTFGTDCVSKVKWSRAFVETLDADAVTTVLAHEAWHKVLMHHLRRGPRDPKLWNVANDFIINAELKRRGFKFPDCLGPSVTMQQFVDGKQGWMFDPQVHTQTTSEEVYDLLLKKQEEKGGGMSPPAGQGMPSQPPLGQPAPGASPSSGQGSPEEEGAGQNSFDQILDPDVEVDSTEQRVAADLVQAAMAARAAGNMPDFAKRIIGQYEKPTEPWRKLLAQFIHRASITRRSDDRSYARPSRRSPTPFVTPSRKHEPEGEYIIAIDTSGSITNDELANYQAQVNTIFATVKPRKVQVVYCDAAISGQDTFERGTKVQLRMCGGGGTDFAPPFDWARENKIDPVCLIYFTDGYGPLDIQPRPRYPVLWAMTTSVQPVFGKCVRLRT